MTSLGCALPLPLGILGLLAGILWPLRAQLGRTAWANAAALLTAAAVTGAAIAIASPHGLHAESGELPLWYCGLTIASLLATYPWLRLEPPLRLLLLSALGTLSLCAFGAAWSIHRMLPGTPAGDSCLGLDAALAALTPLALVLGRILMPQRLISLGQATGTTPHCTVPCLCMLCLALAMVLGLGLSPGAVLAPLAISVLLALAMALYLWFILWFQSSARQLIAIRQKRQIGRLLRQRKEELRRMGSLAARSERIANDHLLDLTARLGEAVTRRDRELALSVASECRKEQMAEIAQRHFCDGELLNTILCNAFLRAQVMGFTPIIRLRLPRGMDLDQPDLCALLSGLFDHALEDCGQLPANQRWITFCAESLGSSLALVIDHSVRPGSPPGAPRPPQHLGVPLLNVVYIVNQRHGTIDLTPGDSKFSVSVILDLRAAA
ncbi:MAG: GHKL domain-containing protein [Succinivibrionaceae bacterium]|nr:GHKL domain-containing protein [Succinivibrionaceae bacterium]